MSDDCVELFGGERSLRKVDRVEGYRRIAVHALLKGRKMRVPITVEELADEWADIVRSCCPNVAEAEWKVVRGDLVLTLYFTVLTSRRGTVDKRRAMDVVVREDLLQAYLEASLLQRTYTTSRLVAWIVAAPLYSLPAQRGAHIELEWRGPRVLTHADLGLALEAV